MLQRRPRLVPALLLAAPAILAVWELCSPGRLFAVSGVKRNAATSHSLEAASNWEVAAPRSRVALAAAASDKAPPVSDDEADSIQVSGFSSFLVGLAFLPYVCLTLYVAFGMTFKGEVFSIGPLGLNVVSALVSVGLVLWSLGSFLQRGRGLPAGPLGLFGLSEGLAYLAMLLLATSLVVSGFRSSGGSGTQMKLPTPADLKLPGIDTPKFEVPSFSAPSFDFKAPDFKAPDFKAPDFKAPDFKAPEFKAPEFKAPEFNFKLPSLPELPKPSPKASKDAAEDKKPEPPKKAEEKKAEEKKPEEKKPEPKKMELPDFEDLFN